MAKLRPMKDEKEIAAVPVDQPVLVVLEPPVSSEVPEGEPEVREPERREPERDEPTDGAKLLQKQLEASEAARTKAADDLRKAQDLAEQRGRELTEARAQTADSESDAVASGLSAAQADAAAAKAAVKAAFEAGDADKLADAQERLGRAGADIREFERAAAALADQKKRTETAATTARTEQPKQFTSVEASIDAQPNLTDPERKWLKEHQDAWVDPSRNNELSVAYGRAVKAGKVRGTPEYFQFIEEFMGYAEPARTDENDTERTTIVAAPVSRDNRSSLSGQPNTGNRIMLTPEQRDLARTMGISEVKYAEQVRNLEREKKANPERYAGRS